jgi:hypothetical protein
LVLIALLAVPIGLIGHFFGSEDQDNLAAKPLVSASTTPTVIPSPTATPSPEVAPSLTPAPPSAEASLKPPPPPPPQAPVDSIGTRKGVKKFFDEAVSGDIDWSDTPSTMPPRERLLGQNNDQGQIIELLGPPSALDEISMTVVMNGTRTQLNERALIPMVRAASEFGGDEAGRFIGGELDEISRQDFVPEKEVVKTFGKRSVAFNSFDVIDTVVMTISVVR